MKKFRIHIVNMAHLTVDPVFSSCAFTNKGIKLAEMLTSLGHEVYFYGAPSINGFRPKCTEFIETHTIEDIKTDYGEGDNTPQCDGLGYRWRDKDGFKSDFNGERMPCTKKFYANAIKEINKRKKPDDFLFIGMGKYHDEIANAVGLYLRCESGIGYRGSNKQNFRAFESAFMMNFTYGSENPFVSMNGNWYDRVIPNFFYPEEFHFGRGKGGYYLCIGRMISRKGIMIAYETAKATGKHLIYAGQGGKITPAGELVMSGPSTEFIVPKGNWEYVGVVGPKERDKLIGNAILTLTPTIYLEPFGGTHIESMLCGTPVLTTNFGVFGDHSTYRDGVGGYHCDTLNDFVSCATLCEDLDREKIKRDAKRFLMGNIRWLYQKWMEDLHDLWESAQSPGIKGWSRVRDKEDLWRKEFVQI